MTVPKGGFVSFEGGDGSGKSTQALLLVQRLKQSGHRVVHTREPGGCWFSEQLRQLLVSGAPEKINDKTELLLMTAARIEHVRQLIEPALRQGQWVVSDRFLDSTLAYQGFGRGMDRCFLDLLQQWAIGGLVPRLTFLLLLEPEEGLRRSIEKRSSEQVRETRFEQEGIAFQRRVNAGFVTLAKESPSRFRVIDATDSREHIARKVWVAVQEVFSHVE
ncbi:MAG: dTMP kinase [Magnetococcales bacterium]|nr:dTMP kinase [Magnetococcales bacterium]MBF0148689.1 dTMP kinase [Magnetococcales bacterium]MBF0173332.1 dTMP kinase [Magnetococcales bacterium]MBF0347288.1 dTMP kinase [Magnetococcales bacterium]MBF0631495.1 dTMP kinase [Magnetococcales bacterium]